MYHVAEYVKMAGSFRKEKYKSPEPPNKMAGIIKGAFNNWSLERPWVYRFKYFEGIGKRGE